MWRARSLRFHARPASPLQPTSIRDIAVSSCGDISTSKNLMDLAELLEDPTSEISDNDSDSGVSVYEECESVISESDFVAGSAKDIDSKELEFIPPENIDDKTLTVLERKLLATIDHLQTANDGLLRQILLKDDTTHPPGQSVHAHITKLQRQRDSYRMERRELKINEKHLMQWIGELLRKTSRLEDEKESLARDRDGLQTQNLGLSTSIDNLRDGAKVMVARVGEVYDELGAHL